MMHGAGILAPMAIEGGRLDEIMMHQVPVMLGDGRRLFTASAGRHGQRGSAYGSWREKGVTHLHCRVQD